MGSGNPTNIPIGEMDPMAKSGEAPAYLANPDSSSHIININGYNIDVNGYGSVRETADTEVLATTDILDSSSNSSVVSGVERVKSVFKTAKEAITSRIPHPNLSPMVRPAGAAALLLTASAIALGVSKGAPNALAAAFDKDVDNTPGNTKSNLSPAYDNFGQYSDQEIANNVDNTNGKPAAESHLDFIKANPNFAAHTAQSAASEHVHQKWAYKKLLGDVPNGNVKHDAALELALYKSPHTITGTLVANQRVVDYDAQKDGSVGDKQERIFLKGKVILGIDVFGGKMPKSAVVLPVDTNGDGEADRFVVALRDLGDGQEGDYSPFHLKGCSCPPQKPCASPVIPGVPSTPDIPYTPTTPKTPKTPTTPKTPKTPTTPKTPKAPKTPKTPKNPYAPESPGKDHTKSPVSSDPNDPNEETRPNQPAPAEAIQPVGAPPVDPYRPPETVTPPEGVGPTPEVPADPTPATGETNDGTVTGP